MAVQLDRGTGVVVNGVCCAGELEGQLDGRLGDWFIGSRDHWPQCWEAATKAQFGEVPIYSMLTEKRVYVSKSEA